MKNNNINKQYEKFTNKLFDIENKEEDVNNFKKTSRF